MGCEKTVEREDVGLEIDKFGVLILWGEVIGSDSFWVWFWGGEWRRG